MEWLILLAALVYLGLALVADSFDALLGWLEHHPRAALRAIAAAMGAALLAALCKGEVGVVIYIAVGSLAGLANLIYDWIKSHVPR